MWAKACASVQARFSKGFGQGFGKGLCMDSGMCLVKMSGTGLWSVRHFNISRICSLVDLFVTEYYCFLH